MYLGFQFLGPDFHQRLLHLTLKETFIRLNWRQAIHLVQTQARFIGNNINHGWTSLGQNVYWNFLTDFWQYCNFFLCRVAVQWKLLYKQCPMITMWILESTHISIHCGSFLEQTSLVCLDRAAGLLAPPAPSVAMQVGQSGLKAWTSTKHWRKSRPQLLQLIPSHSLIYSRV